MPCKGRTTSGSPCGVPESLVDAGTGLCPAHAPGASERLAEIGRKGAEATARRFRSTGLDASDLPTLDGPQTAARWLDVVGRAVATGRLGHREGATVVRAVEAFLRAHEAGSVSDEIERLTAAIAAWKDTGDASAMLEVM